MVLDSVGKSSFSQCKRLLKPDGIYISSVRELIESGKFKPVIDRTYPLDQIVEAYRYVETGQKTGNVVINLTRSH